MPVRRAADRAQGEMGIDPVTMQKISAYSSINRFLQAFIDHVSSQPIPKKDRIRNALPNPFRTRCLVPLNKLLLQDGPLETKCFLLLVVSVVA